MYTHMYIYIYIYMHLHIHGIIRISYVTHDVVFRRVTSWTIYQHKCTSFCVCAACCPIRAAAVPRRCHCLCHASPILYYPFRQHIVYHIINHTAHSMK